MTRYVDMDACPCNKCKTMMSGDCLPLYEGCQNYEEWYEGVDVVPVVHGHWVGEDYDGYADGCPVYFSYRCSKCNAIFQTDDEPLDFDFCPRCGAKMDEGGEQK